MRKKKQVFFSSQKKYLQKALNIVKRYGTNPLRTRKTQEENRRK
jgi:hypothetical protein